MLKTDHLIWLKQIHTLIQTGTFRYSDVNSFIASRNSLTSLKYHGLIRKTKVGRGGATWELTPIAISHLMKDFRDHETPVQ